MKSTFSKFNKLLLLMVIISITCGTTNPVQRIIKQDLQKVPEWAIILEDMKEEGFFSRDYFHKYRILTGTGDTTQAQFEERVTDWIEVPTSYYRQNENYLGMTLASKLPGQNPNRTAIPPGYQYVGDQRYGRWRQDDRGNSFWEFYGKYALFRDLLFGSGTPGLFGGGRRIFVDDYQSYRRSVDNGRPFFGRSGQYGTYGSTTTQTKPSFFERKKTRMQERKSAFSQRVQSRMGRSSRSSVSRSFGRGK